MRAAASSRGRGRRDAAAPLERLSPLAAATVFYHGAPTGVLRRADWRNHLVGRQSGVRNRDERDGRRRALPWACLIRNKGHVITIIYLCGRR